MKEKTKSYFGASTGFIDKRSLDNVGDYYPTPPIAVYSLFHYHTFTGLIWEPAAGKGHISNEINRLGYDCYATDLFDRGNNKIISNIDFLQSELPKNVDNIITNPPYKDGLAESFLEKSLSFNVKNIAFLCRLQFATGVSRYNNVFKKMPPSKVLIFPRRLLCSEETANNLDSRKQFGGMLEYAWFIWGTHNKQNSEIIWIDVDEMAKKRNNETIMKKDLEIFFS